MLKGEKAAASAKAKGELGETKKAKAADEKLKAAPSRGRGSGGEVSCGLPELGLKRTSVQQARVDVAEPNFCVT